MASIISWIGITLSVIALLLFLGALIYYLVTKNVDIWFWILLIVGVVLTSAVAIINMITTDSYIQTLKKEVNTCRQTNPNYVYVPQGANRVIAPSVAQQYGIQNGSGQNISGQNSLGQNSLGQYNMQQTPQQLMIPATTI